MSSPTSDTRRCAVVLGSAGQDGHYLTDYRVTIGYRVVGIGRGRLLSGSAPGSALVEQLTLNVDCLSLSEGSVTS